MNRLSDAQRIQVVSALVEGNSIRATVRMTGVAKNTVVKLLAEIGEACAAYQHKAFHVTLRANGFNATKFGASSALRKRMSAMKRRAKMVGAMFGRELRLTLTLS